MENKYPCPCCGYLTFTEIGVYDICPVCFWEDDPDQRLDPDDEGSNKITLKEARSNYKQFGACMKSMLIYVRKPHREEFPPDEETQ